MIMFPIIPILRGKEKWMIAGKEGSCGIGKQKHTWKKVGNSQGKRKTRRKLSFIQ